jgi:hypothetical protein
MTRLDGANQTAREMTRLVARYSSDIGPMAKWPLRKYYDFVRELPFRRDPAGQETVSRPKYTLRRDWPWRDCDDKSILMGSWCFQNKVPFRFCASSKLPSGRMHHVFPVATMSGVSVPLDATYLHNRLGIEEPGILYKQNLTGDIMSSTLNTYEGNPCMGWSFRKIKKGLKRAGKLSAIAAVPGGGAYLSYKAGRRAMAGEDNAVELLGGDDEELGRSMFSKIKKAAGKATKNPLVKMAIKSNPYASAALAATKGLGKKKKAGGAGTQDVSMPEQEAPKAGIPKAVMIGVPVAAVLVFLLMKKKA